jgi:hypothetical protein
MHKYLILPLAITAFCMMPEPPPEPVKQRIHHAAKPEKEEHWIDRTIDGLKFLVKVKTAYVLITSLR